MTEMKTEELETILELGTETQTRDFKESCPWNLESFTKDILAMTNVQEGGVIIIGVIEETDGSYSRKGILSKDKNTYNSDVIMDQIAEYADPHVYVNISFPKDKKGKEYCAINIEPFKEIPVICRKNGIGLKAGGVYYRNRDGRVQSALVSNSYDMRDILERAAIKLSQRAKDIGYILPTSKDNKILLKAMEDRLRKELGNL